MLKNIITDAMYNVLTDLRHQLDLNLEAHAGIKSNNHRHHGIKYNTSHVLIGNGYTWNSEFQVFTLTSDIEESATRSEDISLDYDFFHSDDMTSLSCGNDYRATVIPVDINIWISRLFLGDADGFSILYYQDVDSLIYWANEAAYRWKLRGMCMWSLGQEDLRLWEYLPKQV